jgi:hypothetical protein
MFPELQKLQTLGPKLFDNVFTKVEDLYSLAYNIYKATNNDILILKIIEPFKIDPDYQDLVNSFPNPVTYEDLFNERTNPKVFIPLLILAIKAVTLFDVLSRLVGPGEIVVLESGFDLQSAPGLFAIYDFIAIYGPKRKSYPIRREKIAAYKKVRKVTDLLTVAQTKQLTPNLVKADRTLLHLIYQTGANPKDSKFNDYLTINYPTKYIYLDDFVKLANDKLYRKNNELNLAI